MCPIFFNNRVGVSFLNPSKSVKIKEGDIRKCTEIIRKLQNIMEIITKCNRVLHNGQPNPELPGHPSELW